MTNLKDIKNRIKSVESTKKITRAMKMVAAAKVKKAENTVKASRPFTAELNNMFRKLLNSVGSYSASTLKIKSAVEKSVIQQGRVLFFLDHFGKPVLHRLLFRFENIGIIPVYPHKQAAERERDRGDECPEFLLPDAESCGGGAAGAGRYRR